MMISRSSVLSRQALLGAVSALLVVVLVSGPDLAHASCSARSDGPGLCPFRVGDTNVFDRCLGAPIVGPDAGKPTALGNAACNAIEKLHDFQKSLGRSAEKMVNGVKRDVNDFITVTMRGAYNPQSIATYNRVARYPNALAKDVDTVLKHRVCGSADALRNLKAWFDQQGQNLIAVGGIAQNVGQAIAALGPAGPEAAKIAQEAAKIAGLVAGASQSAKNEFEALKKAVDTIQRDLAAVAALDVTGTVAAGGDLVVSVGPFVANCGGCAGALAAAIDSLVTGGTATGGGAAACPETAVAYGGSCWAVVAGVPVAAIGTAIGGAIATPTCTAATAGAAKMAEYAQKIEKFLTTSVKLAQSLKSSIDNVVRASQALAALAQTLGRESQPSLKAMETSLNKIVDTTNQSFDIVAGKVAPATARLAGNLLAQLGHSVDTLFACYNMYQDLTFKLGGDTVKAMAELTAATALLVDGGKVADNLYKQSGRAIKAAEDEADEAWQKLHRRDKQIYERLWGVDAYRVDLPRTAAHLLTLTPARVKDIIDDVGDLERDRLRAVAASLDAGKKAFLDQDKLRIARSKFDEAGAKAASAERLFQAAERRPQPQPRAVQALTARPLQTDIGATLGQQRLQRIQTVR